MLRKVDFMPASEAVMMAGKHDHGFISMTDADKPTRLKAANWGAFLHLAVDDVTIEREGWVRFEAEHAETILDWLGEHVGALTTIHVHCGQGISRSATVARFIAARYGLAHEPKPDTRYNMHISEVLFFVEAHREESGA